MSIATKAPYTNRLGGRIDTPINQPIDSFRLWYLKLIISPQAAYPWRIVFLFLTICSQNLTFYHHTLWFPFHM